MDSVATPGGPIRNIGAWTFEQLQAWADRPDHHGQELERIREVTSRHAQDYRLDPADRKRWAKLSLQVNARMHGDSPWQQARMAANNVRLRTNIIDRLGPDIQDPDWNPDLVAAGILAALTLTPTQARELSDHWQALPVERFCELRDVKITTARLQRLLRHLQPGPIRDQAREWLTIRELLP